MAEGPKPHVSSLSMAPNNYGAATEIISNPFNSQIISDAANDVLSTQDIVVGTILAFILAFGWSFLNGQSSSTSFVSWPSQSNNENGTLDVDTTIQGDDKTDKTFNAENWKEISREENYVLYNTKIRQKTNPENRPIPNVNKKENMLILVGLLVLFVPIFSVEFFFALSRLFICEMGMEGELVQKMCSPLITQ